MKKKILILPLMTFMFMLVFVASLVCANSFAVYAEDEYTQVYVVGEPQIDEDEVGVTITITGDDDMLYVYFVKTLVYAKTYTISDFNGKYTRRCSSDRTTINEGPSDATLLIEENGNVEATMITSSGKYKISSKPANIFSSLEDLVTKLPATDTSVNVTVTITDAVIDSLYVTTKGYTNGIYVTAAGTTIQLYYNDVPSTWEVGGKVSGTIKGEWRLYKGEL